MSLIHSIGIAGMKVVLAPEKVRTVLGSCVGVAVYDRVAKIGGLVHVILPSSSLGHGDRGKFADTAIDWLRGEALSAGCEEKRLAAKICGGSSMFGTIVDNGIGEKNIRAVKERLGQHGIRLVAEDTGGIKGRRMLFDPATGDVQVQIIGSEPLVI